MRAQRYYPPLKADQVVWLTNYLGKIVTHGPTCGLSAGEITSIVADITFYLWLLGTWNPAVQQDAQEATAFLRLAGSGSGTDAVVLPEPTEFATPPAPVPPGVLTRLFNQIARMKKNAGYSDPIGADTDRPYLDERDLLVANAAETREYRMRWWDKGEPNGDWSPVQKITIGA